MPQSIYYDNNGFTGNLNKDGSPYVVSGSSEPSNSRFEYYSCRFNIQGYYDSLGYYNGHNIYSEDCFSFIYNWDKNGV
ncbi:hypothetical protein HMSSN036_46720 [Paenibacillus macerans]|nr:hypothetical protein HMSSN036_46720 [Paenibacillus macerans]